MGILFACSPAACSPGRPVLGPERDGWKGETYHVSLAVLSMDDKDAGVRETACLRANLASELLSLYRALSAKHDR